MFEHRDQAPGQTKQISEHDTVPKTLAGPEKKNEASAEEVMQHRHHTLMDLLDYEAERQGEERVQMQIDEDYYDLLQWRPEDARELMQRGQAPLVYPLSRQTIDWIAGTEKRMRKDYKILPREPDDEKGAEVKTKAVKYTDDVNLTAWHRSRAFKQAATGGLGWLEEGANPDPEQEIIYAGSEDWRNIYRDSHSRNIDYNIDARYLFRRRVIDLDYACALLPKNVEHLKAVAGRHEEIEGGDDIWYLGQKLTGASETEWHTGALAGFGDRAAYVSRQGYFDNSRRRAVEMLESWYRVPERVPVFLEGPFQGKIVNQADPRHRQAIAEELRTYEAVKFRMRLMICTRQAPCIDMASPYRHGRFLLVPVWGYRRGRDGLAYGQMRAMRDIQDDLNKRRSKALYALSNNRIVMDEGAVDDIEDARLEAARPDGIIVKKANKTLTFEKNAADFQGNLELAAQDALMLREAGGVTSENLGHDTNAASGKAILAKQDQGSLTTIELFDNLLLAMRQAGRLRLSHIEQLWTEERTLRIVGDRKPIEWLPVNKFDAATGQILNDVTAREADFMVSEQDYRASLSQAAMDQMFELLGKIATFAPQVVLSVLDLVVESAEIKDKEEWVARIRQLNGQRDPSKPPTPEEQEAAAVQQAKVEEQEQLALDTAKAALAEIQAKVDKARAEISKLDVEGVLKRVESMYSALQAAQIVASVPGVTPAADEIAASAGLEDQKPGPIPVPATAAATPEAPENPPGPLVGMQEGIETQTGADNTLPPVDPSLNA